MRRRISSFRFEHIPTAIPLKFVRDSSTISSLYAIAIGCRRFQEYASY